MRDSRRTRDAARATHNFHEADTLVKEWAEAGEELTVERIRELNRTLGEGLEHNDRVPGALRGAEDEVFGSGKLYVPGDQVERALGEFMTWYRAAEAAGMEPIELAARSYQRLVSIHPFFDGNGRTARMVMDYVLRKNDLPPAAMDEVNVAVYAQSAQTGATPTQALEQVTQGVENSLDLIERFGR